MTCRTCRAKDRDEIDLALVSGQGLRSIADRSSISKTSLIRHRNSHLSEAIASAKQAQLTKADVLVATAAGLLDKALGLVECAEAAQDVRGALAAMREARSTIGLLARLKPADDDNDGTVPSPRRWAKFITIVAEEFDWRPKLGEELDHEMMIAVRGVLNDFSPRLRLGAHERLTKKLDALDEDEQ
jgi:hypothetical protein